VHIHLTRAGRALRRKLVPYAIEVNEAALAGISAREIAALQNTLTKIRRNLARREARRNGVEER
jgi:DNA-binding MarR family transcriptional regulator